MVQHIFLISKNSPVLFHYRTDSKVLIGGLYVLIWPCGSSLPKTVVTSRYPEPLVVVEMTVVLIIFPTGYRSKSYGGTIFACDLGNDVEGFLFNVVKFQKH